jgi:hypothetical protein
VRLDHVASVIVNAYDGIVSYGRGGGVGRGLGVNAGLGVGEGLGVKVGVAVGVAVDVGVTVGVCVAVGVTMTVAVAVAVGVAVAVAATVGVAVAVGVGVGVEEPDCAQYLPPVLKTLTLLYPAQTIISPPVQTPACQKRAAGAPLVLVAVQLSVPGSYLPPVFNEVAF